MKKYGWEICDEVQRFVGNTAEIEFVTKALSDEYLTRCQEYSTTIAELEKRYRSIELANKEMSRNDHVVFGDLLMKNKQLEQELEKHRWRQAGAQVDPTPEAYAALEEKLKVAVAGLEKISEMECRYGEGGCDSDEKRNVAWKTLAAIDEAKNE